MEALLPIRAWTVTLPRPGSGELAACGQGPAPTTVPTWPARVLEVGSLSFLQAIFPTQGSNPGLPHCRRILYQLSH